MKTFKYVDVVVKEIDEWKCDICGLDFLENEIEAQESIEIHKFGGYGSIFGDGSEYHVDMCQHCLNKILGEYINVIIED